MTARSWLVIAVVAAAGAGVAWRMRGGEAPPVAPPPGAPVGSAAVAAGSASAPSRATPAPVTVTSTAAPALPALPAPVISGPALSLAQQLAAEPRDARWATATEADLRRRLGALGDLHIDAIDCHTSLCKLELSGRAAELTAVTDRAPRLPGLQLTLSTVTEHEGQVSLSAFAAFPRDVATPTAPDGDD